MRADPERGAAGRCAPPQLARRWPATRGITQEGQIVKTVRVVSTVEYFLR